MVAGCHVKPEQFFNLIFGFNAIVSEYQENLSAAAGDNWLIFSTVPTGEVWIITLIAGVNRTSAPTRIDAFDYDGANYRCLGDTPSPGASVHAVFHRFIPIAADHSVRVRVRGCVLNDDIDANILGFKMKLSQ
uniref:Uncharacterized protein n=1 Tax=viral metagenome TaxID=1070528 RepID=A0A6H1ZVR7_9ZZZZ